MNDSNRQKFNETLDDLFAFYEALPGNRDFWWTALSKYPVEQVQAGFEAHIADPEHGQYPPKPAHVIGHIERLYPKRSGAYKPFAAEPSDTKRLPLNYEFTPLYWEKFREGFNTHGLRGPQLARWAREQAGVKLIVGDPCRQWLDEHADDPIVKRAQLLAEGKGSDEDKHEHLQELIQMCKGTPLPYDKERREDVERSTKEKREEAIDESMAV